MADRKESNVVLNRIVSFLSKEDEEALQKMAEDAGHESFEIRANEAYTVQDNGDMYIIDNEGTGNEDPMQPGEENVIVVDVYPVEKDSIALMAFARMGFSYEEVLSMDTEEELLHDYVRKFGSRLEANYELWKNKLEAVPA